MKNDEMVMKLNQAIREGAKFRPQTKGNWFSWHFLRKSCALGAAFEATHPEINIDKCNLLDLHTSQLEKDYPILNKNIANPVTGKIEWLQNVIADLNDHQNWTREEIADWVETIEKKYV